MITENKLNIDDFKRVVQHAPLFAIDLVVVNEKDEILVGRRTNPPAKETWFVPGGRVYKNETLQQAIQRISISELNHELAREELIFLGMFEHFYTDSFFGSDVSTHYINATHAIRIKAGLMNLPNEQHESYKWVNVRSFHSDAKIHENSKLFLASLKTYFNFKVVL